MLNQNLKWFCEHAFMKTWNRSEMKRNSINDFSILYSRQLFILLAYQYNCKTERSINWINQKSSYLPIRAPNHQVKHPTTNSQNFSSTPSPRHTPFPKILTPNNITRLQLKLGRIHPRKYRRTSAKKPSAPSRQPTNLNFPPILSHLAFTNDPTTTTGNSLELWNNGGAQYRRLSRTRQRNGAAGSGGS